MRYDSIYEVIFSYNTTPHQVALIQWFIFDTWYNKGRKRAVVLVVKGRDMIVVMMIKRRRKTKA